MKFATQMPLDEVYLLLRTGHIERQQCLSRPLVEDYVRVRFLACGLCGSDMSKFEGTSPVSLPFSLGHEFIAQVEEVGSTVPSLKPGDFVTSDLNFRCGACDHCLAGRSHLCRVGQSGLFSNRAFASRGNLHHSYLLPLEADPSRHLVLSEPLSCVLYALDWAAPKTADRVLVVGAGGIGLCAAFALSLQAREAPFDIADIMSARLLTLDSLLESAGRAVLVPAGEYDVVLDVSGTAAGLATACRSVRGGGTVCSMSHLDRASDAAFLLAELTRRDVNFKVSYLNGPRENLRRAVRMLASSWNPSWDVLIEQRPLRDLQSVLDGRRKSPFNKSVIVISGA
jgi:threonine dehydrogenase-like Zn-dependent dehydrogenase